MKRAVSLILILSLILAIFAIPAQASAVGTGIIISASAAAVISAACIALGVSPGTDGSVFNGLVSAAADYLADLGIGDGVTIPILKYLGPGGAIQYALQSTVLAVLRNLLFDEGVVHYGDFSVFGGTVPGNTSVLGWYDSSGSEVLHSVPSSATYLRYYTLYPSGTIIFTHLFFSTSDLGLIYNYYKVNGVKYYCLSWQNNVSLDAPYVSLNRSISFENPYVDNKALYSIPDLISMCLSGDFTFSPYDVTLGDVAAQDTPLADAYPDWAVDSVQVDPGGDDEDPVPYIPIGLGDTLEDVLSSSQEDVQSGVSSLETPNEGTEVNISGDVGGSITPDGGGSGDLPSGDGAVTVDDLTTMFAWLAVRIDEAVESLFPDLQVIKTYLKTIAQWHETENVKYDSMLSYFSGWDTDFDTMLTNLANIDLNLITLVDHAAAASDTLAAIAADVQDIRDVIADPLDGDINEEEQDNKNAFLNTFSKKSQADNIGDLSGLSDGFTEWFSLDVDPLLLFDQMDTGFTDWFTSETAQAISVGGGAAATGISLMDDAEYEDPETPYLDAWDQEVQNILSGGDGEW